MRLRSRRTVQYLALVIATTVLFSITYDVGMSIWEGRPRSIVHSIQIVFQSFTTTGYGEDAPWSTPQMNVLAITMQLAGIGLILTAVDVFVVPWLRDAVSASAPTAAPDASDHVIVCEHTPRTDAFITELEARDQAYVLIETDADVAAECNEAGYRVIHADPESTEAFEAAAVDEAIAVVADAADDRNASIALAARDVAPEVRIVTLVEDAALGRYHHAAGADEVLSPRQLLGRSLAQQVPTPVTTEVSEGVTIGEDFELVEFVISEGSDLAGQTVDTARLRQRFGVNVIGGWFDGDFETPVSPDAELAPGTRLLVAGKSPQVSALREATASTVQTFGTSPIVLAGYGDSGQAAAEALPPADEQVTILDVAEGEEIDVVGDARDPDVLAEAGIEDASALLLTVADDTTAIFTTLIARELNPDLRVIVRANEEEDVQKLYRAGAEYVQSLATVSGRMLAGTIFEDQEVLAYEQQVSIVRLPAGSLAGNTIAEEAVRTATGCTIVAVVRDDETITEFDPETFGIEPGDDVVIAGDAEAVTRFEEVYGD
jgi:Trk K+ transport system NAD-binding subunit